MKVVVGETYLAGISWISCVVFAHGSFVEISSWFVDQNAVQADRGFQVPQPAKVHPVPDQASDTVVAR
eukprot:CAMPEP_0113951108 /NCGR_PEP_ID=MMETSP1339-20121228/84385_1 /TAXON_ID=94617 /ORGANISM="Fibrocapsa japonica" /LENGTH=67 /DNA_ID=CAMNT_0000959235 /DNA_START=41 /DNA_END=241 /DNA_ORIENTATION=- /assembly_acc=CAM_ASM_000762